MAKNLNIQFKGDNRGLVSAIKGIQGALHGVEKTLKSFKAELKSMGTAMGKISRSAKSMNSAIKKTSDGVDKIGDEARKSATEVDKLNRSLNKISGTSKAFGSISNGFRNMGRDIMNATKLMTTFAVVAGGIQLNRAKNEYLDYSNEMMVLGNIANPYNNQAAKEALITGINQAALTAGVNPAEFVKSVSPIVSGAIPINIGKDTSDKEAASQVKEVTAALGELGIWAKGHGGKIEDSAEMYTRTMLSMGKSPDDLKSSENIKSGLGLLSRFMDESVGDLHTLSTGISRVVLTGMAVPGATIEGVLARYARGTKLKSVMLASRHTSALSRSESSQFKESGKAARSIRSVLKGEKDSEGVFHDYTGGTAEETARYRKFLQGYDTTEEIRNKIFRTEGDDGELRQATPEEVLGNYMDAMQKAEDLGLGAGEFLSMIQGAQEVRLELMSAFKGGELDINRIIENFGTEESRIALWDQKRKNVTESPAYIYDQVSTSYTTATNVALGKMGPSLAAVGKSLTAMFTGEDMDLDKLNKVFNDNYEAIKKTNPFLAEMVKYMQNFAEYVAKGGLKEDFEAIAKTMLTISKAIGATINMLKEVYDSGPIKLLRNILGGGAGADLVVALGGMAAFKLGISSIFSLMGATFAQTLGGAAVVSAAGKTGAAIAAGFSASAIVGAGLIGGAIGLVIGNNIVNAADAAFDKKNFKGTKEEIKKGTAIVKFDTLNNEQRRIIAKSMSKMYKGSDIGAGADKYLTHGGGFNLQNPLEQVYFAVFKEFTDKLKKKGTSIENLEARFGKDLKAFINAERDQFSTNPIFSTINRAMGGSQQADLNSANAVMQYLNEKAVGNLDSQTTRLEKKLDKVVEAIININISGGGSLMGEGTLAPGGTSRTVLRPTLEGLL